MARFILLQRLASMIFVLFAISVLVFLIFFATPGVDPAARIAGRNADQQTLRQVRHDFGLDQPAAGPVRDHDEEAVHHPRPHLVREPRREGRARRSREAAPVTLSLVLGAAVIWVVFSVGMGLMAAVFRGTPVDAA